MISPFLPAHDADTVALDFGVFIAEHARTYRTSQTAIIAALRPIITDIVKPISTPSAPDSHAPAADTSTIAPVDEATDGAAGLTTHAEPSVELSSPLHFSDQPAGTENEVEPTPSPVRKRGLQNEVLRVHSAHRDWPASVIAGHIGTGREYVCATAKRLGIVLPSQREYDAAQAEKTDAALRVAIQPETPPPAIPEPAIEAPSKPPTLAQRIAAHVAEHPDATLREVTDALGIERMASVGWAAQKAGIVLRKRNAQERSQASARGAQGRAKPSVAVTPPPEAEQPPEATPEPRKAVVYRHSSPPGRFYLRDRDGRYLHNSLTKCPTGPGPLMTTDRKWAWCDNFQRFKGARKLWPELATMRKEAPQS